MTSVNTWESVCDIRVSFKMPPRFVAKLPFRELVAVLREQRLLFGLASAQSEDTDAVGGEINFGSDQTAGPMSVCQPGMAQQFHRAVIVGSAEEHQASLGMALQV